MKSHNQMSYKKKNTQFLLKQITKYRILFFKYVYNNYNFSSSNIVKYVWLY
jgi:hypothetical protein